MEVGLGAVLAVALVGCAATPAPTDPATEVSLTAPCPGGEPSALDEQEAHAHATAVSKANEGDHSLHVDLEAAIRRYEEAHAASPHDHRITRKLVLAYEKKEAFADVARVLQASTAEHPEFADDWAGLGRARLRLGDAEGARTAFSTCANTDANRAECRMGLADAMLLERMDADALRELDRAVRQAPSDVRGYLALANLYRRLERPDEAAVVVLAGEGVASLSDADRAALALLAGALASERGDLPAAISALERARTWVAPDSLAAATLLYSLGALYAQSQPPRRAEALELLGTFSKRVCRSSKAAQFALECSVTTQMLTTLGGAP